MKQSFRNIKNFFHNIYKFRKALWRHRWYDYQGTLHFMEIGVADIAKNTSIKGIEVERHRFKKIEKMNRVVEILRNIRESAYFDLVEAEMGRGYDVSGQKFVPLKENPDYYDLVNNCSEEQKDFNDRYFKRVNQLEEQQWNELWDIMKGQDTTNIPTQLDYDTFYDGSDMRGWWD
jgi:hypothetical protein